MIARSDGSFSSLLEHDDPAPLLAHLQVDVADYWMDHHRFDQISKPGPKRLGEDAAMGLIINAIVPYLFAMGRVQGREDLGERALKLLEQLPPEKNTLVEGWAQLGIKADSAARSQALIELKNQYCGQRRCLSCVVGTSLLKR